MTSSPAVVRSPVSIGAARRSFAPWADPAAKPLIGFEGVTKRFGETTAVDSLSLDIYEREFFCLLGPSGCGKSTLMRMLAGFEEPTSGRVTLGGENLAGVPPHRRPVNMMFQSYALFPHMTVEANIAFGLRQEGRPRPEIAERTLEMLRLVQLEPLARRYPEQLSGGQRQRVALARALVKRPKVLLLDEPLGALDKKLREETQFELMDLQVRLGATFLMVTHDQEEAMTMATRIAVMDRGRIAQVSTPGEIYERPASRFVAEFVGDVNILEGRAVGSGEGGLRVECPSARATFLVEDGAGRVAEGAEVALAIRPEKMALHRERPEGAANAVEGVVWDIGYLGDWTVYRVRTEAGAVLRVARPNSSRLDESGIGWDDRVHVSFPPAAVLVLDR